MLRFWVEQIAAVEFTAMALIAVALGATIVAWIAVRRLKQSGR